MTTPNMNYKNLKNSYLFYNIEQKTNEYVKKNPNKKLCLMGVGDVTLPLSQTVINALHKAVDDQANANTFHGYVPECGTTFLRESIQGYYKKRNVTLSKEEIFISSGAGDDLGNILDLFDVHNTVLVIEPTYPAYVDSNIMAGRQINYLHATADNNFLPLPNDKTQGDIIYICSPNNPTGSAYTKEQMKKWVDFANEKSSVIIFDGAYEAFIEDENIPHSIYEIENAKKCAIEICSLSKTAGFTGTRLGYTVIPRKLVRNNINFNDMWVRNRTTKSNGVSYIIQKGAVAVFTPEGQEQIHKNIQLYKDNAKLLMNALDEVGIWYCGGKNAPYIWLKCPCNMDSWEFFDFMLNNAQIVGTPGEGFGEYGKGYFRFSTFASREDTEETARKIISLFKKD